MNVLLYSTHVMWPSHYETELEIIQEHLDAGDAVVQAVCDKDFPSCDMARVPSAYTCRRCIERRRKGRALLSGDVPTIPIIALDAGDRAALAEVRTEFSSVAELASYSFDGFDVGAAVASSLISWLRDPNPDMVKHRKVIQALVRSSAELYRSVGRHLDRHPVDRVYVFNGRFAHPRAILRACQARNVECFAHERGHDIRSYALYPNALPHSIANMDRMIRDSWERASAVPDRDAVGEAFFTKRANGVATSWFSFTKDQHPGLLPETWGRFATHVAVFNSSEDEFASIGSEWKQRLYENQLDGVRRIARSLEGRDDVQVFLRMHPNSGKMSPRELEKWYGLQSKALTVIAPDSPVSTYALLRAADKVVTFGSTMVIEAVFWGKPSILAGASFFERLGATYNPRSHEELVELLVADLPPKDRTAALMYGFHMSTFGRPFKWYVAESFDAGKFKGVDLAEKKKKSRVHAWLSQRAREARARVAALRGRGER
jgi:hypothetical protein